jgi:ADP-ribosylglycohydrolase
MLGAIIGDIVGSVYEFDNHRSKDFPLFREDSKFTDDTILTIATADALLHQGWDFAGKYLLMTRRLTEDDYRALSNERDVVLASDKAAIH